MKTILFAILAALMLAGCVGVPTSSYGVVSSGWGHLTGEVKDPGLYPVIPMTGYAIHVMDGQTHTVKIQTDGATSDRQIVHAEVSLIYHISSDPKTVVSLYNNFRGDYEGRLIDPNILTALKASTVRFNSTDVLTKRADVQQDVQTAANKFIAPRGIVIDQVAVSDLHFEPDYQKSIEQTAQAVQDQKTAQIQAQTDKIKAQGQANAQLTQKVSLTDKLLEQQWIAKWDGHVSTVSGSTGGMILDLKDLQK